MRRIAAMLVAATAVSSAAAPAHAQNQPVVPVAPSAGEVPPAPAPTKDEFGWQIILADLAGIAATVTAGQYWDSPGVVAPYLLASPTVHLAHGDVKGAAVGLLLHVVLPVSGAFIGYGIASQNCSPGEWFCGLGGVALGGLAGLSLATAVDATFFGSVERPATVTASSKRGLAATPALAVGANGRFALSLAGRF